MIKRLFEKVKLNKLNRKIKLVKEFIKDHDNESNVLSTSIELSEELFNLAKGNEIEKTDSKFYSDDEKQIIKFMSSQLYRIECDKKGNVCLTTSYNFSRDLDGVKFDIIKYEIKPGII